MLGKQRRSRVNSATTGMAASGQCRRNVRQGGSARQRPLAPYPEMLEPRRALVASLSLRGPATPVVEGDPANFTLTLSEPVSTPVSVTVTTTPGPAIRGRFDAATLGQDYFAPASQKLTFAPGQIQQTFSISTLRDSGGDVAEGPPGPVGARTGIETFTVTATPASSSLRVQTARVEIRDYVAPLPVVSVSPPTFGVGEGFPAVFTISLSQPPGNNKMVTVRYATRDGTATAGTDYTAASGQVTFVGSETTKTVAVSTIADATLDTNETFSLNLSLPTGATINPLLSTATATILDTTIPLPVASISGPTLNVTEGYFAEFTVTLSYAPGNRTVSIPYATNNGPAPGGAFGSIDYVVTSGTLTFSGSEVSKTVAVRTLADSVVEAGGETFSMTISPAATAATVGTGTASATIVDPVVPTVPPPPVGTYSPQQIRQAYGLNYGGNGAGTTIAIVAAGSSPTIRQDLNAFNLAYNLPFPPTFTIVNQSGGAALPGPIGSWPGEITLDVQWAHAIAPGADILLVCADSALTADLFAAIDYARNVPGVSVVSMSFGTDESSLTAADIRQLDQILTTPSGHQPVTFVAAAGDNGQVAYPASSANVLAVGGTRLTLSPSGGYGREVVWNDFLTSGLATGGGPSRFVRKPTFQSGVNTGPNNTVGTTRGVPDVSFSATNVPVYFNGAWQTFVGTSFSAPAWAGIVAIANGRRLANGQGTLQGTQNAIYAMPASNFRDITQGNNGSYSATRGYDLVTGRGSPIGNFVIRDLIAYGGSGTTVIPTARSVGPSPPITAFATAFGMAATGSNATDTPPSTVMGRPRFSAVKPLSRFA